MRTHVTVDGITLSRKQVEAAVVELNKPEYEPQGGDIVEDRTSGERFLVVGGHVANKLNAEHGVVHEGCVRVTDGCSSWSMKKIEKFKKVGSMHYGNWSLE